MHQASLIGEYIHDSTDYGWPQLEQGLKNFFFKKIKFFVESSST
jgi:hypothetical protein